MYVAVRRYTGDPDIYNDLKEKIESELIPQFRTIPGFSAYYAIDTGGGSLATVSVFGTLEGEKKSTALAAEFVKKNYGNKVQRITVDEGVCIVEQHAGVLV
jgi:hypothetical protein